MTLSMNIIEPVQHLDRGLLITRDAVWAWGKLATVTGDSEEEKEAQAWEFARLLTMLRQGDYHLLRVPLHPASKRWSEDLLAVDCERALPGWAGYVEGQRSVLERRQARLPQVHLGRLIADRRAGGLWGGWKRLERGMALEEPLTEHDLEGWRPAAEDFFRVLAAFQPQARPSPCAELRRLVWRPQWRGLEQAQEWEAPLADEPGDGRDGLTLLNAHIGRGWGHLRLGDHDEIRMAVLCAHRLPPDGLHLGWLAPEVGFPLEVSVRFRLEMPLDAERLADRAEAAAADMARHMAEAGVPPSPQLREQVAAARGIKEAQRQRQDCMVVAEPRFVVWGQGEAELAERVSALINLEQGRHIQLACPRADQWTLFKETLPGQTTRLGAGRQTMPPETFGGGLILSGGELGDGRGPYLGAALGDGPSVNPRPVPGLPDQLVGKPTVCADLGRWQGQREPRAILITGDTGSGKTNCAMKLAAEARMRGATVVFVDPSAKRDAEGLVRLPHLGEVRRLRLGDYPGLLDPFRTQSDSGQAALLAADLLQRFLPPGFGGAGGEVPALVQSACHREAQRADRAPSMRGVIERVREYSDHPSAGLVADNLESVAAMPLARPCFGEPEVSAQLLDRLTLIQFPELRLPAPGLRPEQCSLQERLAMGLMTGVMGLLSPLIELGDERVPKLLVIDEAWLLMASDVARSLIDRYVRLGRSKNTVLLLATQNAADVEYPEVVNNVGQVFSFRRQSAADVEAACRIMGLKCTSKIQQLVRRAARGECLYRDSWGRCGRLQVDLVHERMWEAFDTQPGAQRWTAEVA